MSFVKSLATSGSRASLIRNHLNPVQPIRNMASLPKTMKGVSIAKTGGNEVLEYKTDLPVPEPGEGEILIKNDFIGINYIDTYFRTGLYPAPHMPYILGREAAGTIVSVGASTAEKPIPDSLKPGASVVYLGQYAYAEYTATPSLHAFAIPDSMDKKTAAASLLQGLTALTLIREGYHVKKGDWVLVHAAAGGMGLWLCQLLKSVGAHTIGTASTPEKRQLAKAHGADVVVEYPQPGEMGMKQFVGKMRHLTKGEGVAAVFDGVGKDTFDASLFSLKRKGSLISFGNASGAVPPVNIAKLSQGNAKLMRPTLFGFIATREEFETYAKELFEILERENIKVNVHEVYDLKDVANAHSDLEGRKTTGKLVLKA